MARILLTYGVIFFFGMMIKINVSARSSNTKVDQLIRDICEQSNENDSYSNEDKKWYVLCQEWIENNEQKRDELGQNETITEESSMKLHYRPRRAYRSRGRYSSRRSYRSYRSGIRSSFSFRYFRNIRTRVGLRRPTGWQWVRTQSVFLPLSNRYYHRFYPSHHQYTTVANHSETYYYCTSAGNSSTMEIQCSTADGDTKCCENELMEEVYCCGDKVSADFIEDKSRAAEILAGVFYTLTAVTLCIHVFLRRFYS